MRIGKYLLTLSLLTTLFGTPNFLSANDCCYQDCNDNPLCGGRFNVSADWLYMKVQEDSTRVAEFIDDMTIDTLSSVDAKAIQPGSKYNNGFRVNVGYELPCSQWGLNVSYTYLKTNFTSTFAKAELIDPSHSQAIIPNNIYFPSFDAFANQSGFEPFSSLLTTLTGHLSYLDVDFSRGLTFCDCFHLRPHLGFRAAWMNQSQLCAGTPFLLARNETSFARLNFSEKFTGYGLEGGLWGSYDIGCGFSLVGHIGGSILYSNFKLKLDSQGFLGEEGELVFAVTAPLTLHTATPTVEYSVKLEYQDILCDFIIGGHVGWEQFYFFDLYRFSTVPGNLSAQGLVLGLDVGF